MTKVFTQNFRLCKMFNALNNKLFMYELKTPLFFWEILKIFGEEKDCYTVIHF